MVDAPILVDASNGAEFYKQPIYYFLGHFSKFVPAGSQRIKLSLAAHAKNAQTFLVVVPLHSIVTVILPRSTNTTVLK
ncbi:unnamed protein product [Peronospora belbahrii]|uniref:Glycosyl hydrolase family 30 TIM-barrel domain-containing protein n=1 Tax=Peronospora belbahrii TaxID=622444 RepID=A0AAU9L9Q7_9STRA|nr:unnamed protein product [Peronospora belbahrii]CAH0517313.1 unnamed protein product [Peronospora belbahrii]